MAKRRESLEEVFTKAGLIPEWMERGRVQGIEQGREQGIEKGLEKGKEIIAQNMVNMGLPFETVVSATQLDPKKVRVLYKPLNKFLTTKKRRSVKTSG